MARYRIMYWKEFPLQVQARDQDGKASAQLPERFQQAVDAAAMADSSTSTDDYLDNLTWGAEQEREGSAQAVADAVAMELSNAYPPERLSRMVKSRPIG